MDAMYCGPSGAPPLVASIVNLSRKTFRRCPATKQLLLNGEEFDRHTEDLRGLLRRLTPEDLGLNRSPFLGQQQQREQQQRRVHLVDSGGSLGDMSHSTESSSTSLCSSSSSGSVALSRRGRGRSPTSYPLGYISIYENLDVTIGVFLIRSGKAIPLHNHPGMFGFLKCLTGTMEMTAFTKVVDDDCKTNNSIQVRHDDLIDLSD